MIHVKLIIDSLVGNPAWSGCYQVGMVSELLQGAGAAGHRKEFSGGSESQSGVSTVHAADDRMTASISPGVQVSL